MLPSAVRGLRDSRLCLALLLALAACSPVCGQETQMRVRAGFDGNCKESEWFPLAVDLSNRGQEIRGFLEVVVPSVDGRTRTTYRRPVVLGAKAQQTLFVYLRGASYLGRPTVTLASSRGSIEQQPASVTWLSPEDSLVAVLGRERGTLSFLSGTSRMVAGGRRVMPTPGSGGGTRGAIRVGDCDPDTLPDLPQGYSSVDLLVVGDIPLQSLRAEAGEAIRKWVLAGGTLVVMGGPDWARLKDPFYDRLLPVQVAGGAEVKGLEALSSAYASPLAGSAVITRVTPRAGATVRLRQGDLPLIVEGQAGTGRVIFLAFDAMRPPLRGWAGQAALWNGLLDRAQRGTPMLHAALLLGMHGGPFPDSGDRLAGAVLNVPAMKVPPFWWVAFFLGAYVILLVPVNYAVLKWLKRRELAWLTTPAIVVLFVLLAYGIGYSMKGGRLLVNQLSLIETRAGARAAGVTSYAGLFSPAKTAYDIGAEDPASVISEASLTSYGSRQRNLSVLQTEVMSLPRVAMDMWSMRVFRMEGLADLKEGIASDLALTADGHVVGSITNRTGLDLTDCDVRMGDVRWQGNLPDGQSVAVDLDVGKAKPAEIAPAQINPYAYYGPGYGGATAGDQMRSVVRDVFLGAGAKALSRGEVVLTGWADRELARLTVDGKPVSSTSRAFLVVHLPVTLGRRGEVLIPYGACEGAVTEEQGTHPVGYEQPGLTITDGYVVKEFRLPLGEAALRVTRLEVASNYDAGAQTAKPKLQVYNWQSRAWDDLPSSRGRVPVKDPSAHVLLPEGLVRVKFVYHPATGAGGGAPASGGPSGMLGGGRGGGMRMGPPGGSVGGELRLWTIDILVRGRVP